MDQVFGSVAASLQQMMGWELIAVLLALAYLILALRENIYCWHCALASTAIYTVLFWQVALLMESALNVYYMGMAVFGWWQWRRGGKLGAGVQIHRWPLWWHLAAIGSILIITAVSGNLLANHTGAAWPYLDAWTTWSAVFTTVLVARKVLENWLYWIVIDAVSIFLYLDRGLYLTAILFGIYIVLCVFGYLHWRKQMHQQANTDPSWNDPDTLIA